MRTRKAPDGLHSVSHAEKQTTGRVYVRSALIELGKADDFDGFVKVRESAGEGGAATLDPVDMASPPRKFEPLEHLEPLSMATPAGNSLPPRVQAHLQPCGA